MSLDTSLRKPTDRCDSLLSVLDGAESLSVVCHNNPDPDSISSALALAAIAESASVADVDLYYSGKITHQQNRAMVNLLDVDLCPFSEECLDSTDLMGFVDHAVPGQNNRVPDGYVPDIVIDHHPNESVEGVHVDHREEIGATASILTEYLVELDMELDARLATALLFGIRRETLEFTRDATEAEYTNARYLHPHADVDLLRRLSDSLFTHETLDSIADAIQNRVVKGSHLVSHAGRTTERDTLPQAADYLLNLEGVSTTLVFGIIDEMIHLSARTRNPRVHAGNLMTEAFGDIGSVGGHRAMAGGAIPLGLFGALDDRDDALVELVSEVLTERFFEQVVGTP
ncbi:MULTISPECIES: bifunctional oligoribonuclease/PAP phosphatase NrnA [unclassified Haladaptatus]|uniref:DHH family phosphoesterase n=1 Tax=unclassified Haladaptatus TaxID=2622732 RepID=UPI00209C5905|nr:MULTISPECIES: bifunctional oligoribonuclease/PAP phosphatase NrnA [unclassified Haladaptatus]MCO8243352.1 bifunctional oligoribonuclease/PAP phosphatase NrnA [Haladaptatus sp. AB643]MCO8253063.1 bifunctional oligoribonuclease/PAP phosphatase NrnA [Haladaptatus sp. AB618]